MPETRSWEFLIQQDGDREWLPLDAPDVEVLEGRYRIAARSQHKNTAVKIRIRHDAIAETPPRRRTQARTQQTNPNGLMVVIPFTRLNVGQWEFSCVPGDGRPHSVQLHVLPIESDMIEDWNPDLDNELELAPETLESMPGREASRKQAAHEDVFAPERSTQNLLHQAEQDSEQIADEILHEYGLIPEEEDVSAPQPANVEAAPSIASISNLSIVLDQETYIAQRDQALTLTGRLISTQIDRLNPVELRMHLRDPQTSKTLSETRETLEDEALPFELVYRIALPTTLETQLVLGEITLHDLTSVDRPIASQSFTLIADASGVLETIRETESGDCPDEEILDLPATKPTLHPPLNLAFLNFVEAPKNPEAVNFTAKDTQPLPPQIHQPNSYTRRKLDLPMFGALSDESSLEDREPTATQLEIPLTGALLPEPTIEAEPDPAEDSPTSDAIQTEIDRFEPIEEVNSELKVHADDREVHAPEALLEPVEIKPSPDPIVNEFVIDDEPILPLSDLIVSRRQKSAEPLAIFHNPFLLNINEPVPVPVLELAQAELRAGKPAIVHFKLPDILPKLYIKVWISDRQTRAVLEPPRWIMNFRPDGHGNLESTAELNLPLGSVEIQIEAIAVEVMSDRESHKVTLDRRVDSEALPDLWLDHSETD